MTLQYHQLNGNQDTCETCLKKGCACIAVPGHPCVACKKSKRWCSHTPARSRHGARRKPAVKADSQSWKSGAPEGVENDEIRYDTDPDVATRHAASPGRPKMAMQVATDGGMHRVSTLRIPSQIQNKGATPWLGMDEQSQRGKVTLGTDPIASSASSVSPISSILEKLSSIEKALQSHLQNCPMSNAVRDS